MEKIKPILVTSTKDQSIIHTGRQSIELLDHNEINGVDNMDIEQHLTQPIIEKHNMTPARLAGLEKARMKRKSIAVEKEHAKSKRHKLLTDTLGELRDIMSEIRAKHKEQPDFRPTEVVDHEKLPFKGIQFDLKNRKPMTF